MAAGSSVSLPWARRRRMLRLDSRSCCPRRSSSPPRLAAGSRGSPGTTATVERRRYQSRRGRRGVAPAVGFEPTTWRLTAARSTTELRRNGSRASRPHRPRLGGRSEGYRSGAVWCRGRLKQVPSRVVTQKWRSLVLFYLVLDARYGSGLGRQRARRVMGREERDGVAGHLPPARTWSPWYCDWMTGRLRPTGAVQRADEPIGLTPERWSLRSRSSPPPYCARALQPATAEHRRGRAQV